MFDRFSSYFDFFSNPKIISVANFSTILALILTVISISNLEIATLFKSIPFQLIILGLLITTLIIYYIQYVRLKQNINDGAKILNNDAMIEIDLLSKQYRFTFTKKFKIIKNGEHKRFKAQFYCNRFLNNKEKANEFYSKNTPSWASLNVQAFLKYKSAKDKHFCSPIELLVTPVTDNSFYIPFNIFYSRNNGDQIRIPITKGSIIELKYGYTVSAELWGSYLNRSLSYFGEKATVTLQHSNNIEDIDIRISQLPAFNSTPVEVSLEIEKDKTEKNHTYKVTLPVKSFAKYRFWWDSGKLLGIPSTLNAADDSHMTDY